MTDKVPMPHRTSETPPKSDGSIPTARMNVAEGRPHEASSNMMSQEIRDHHKRCSARIKQSKIG